MHVEDLRILSDCARTTLPFSGYSFMELMFQVLQMGARERTRTKIIEFIKFYYSISWSSVSW
jgi:hypothetical protein